MKQPKKLTREQKECLSAHYLNCKDGYRCSGQTTADVLRNLVGERTSESIYLERPKNRMEDFYQKELIEIKRKLDDKGIISRDIERKKR